MADDDTDDFKRHCLQCHNDVRAQHQTPPLLWSNELAEAAQNWADKLAHKRFLTYSELPVGENITFFPPEFDAPQVVNFWLKERDRYDFEAPGWQAGTNYFTQIVWKGSSEIGIGRAYTPGDKQSVVVAFYKPQGNGNRPGEFVANVLKENIEINGLDAAPNDG